ncbi:hypothetical protein [Halochromatium sp.]
MLKDRRPLPSIAALGLMTLLLAGVFAGALADARPTAGADDSGSATALKQQLAVAGLSLPETRSFLDRLEHAVAQDDREAVAAMSDYPITVAAGKEILTLDSPSRFAARYPDFMTHPLRQLIAEARLENLFANYQGAMLGNGALWFGPVCKQEAEPQNLDACPNPPVLLIRINGLQ